MDLDPLISTLFSILQRDDLRLSADQVKGLNDSIVCLVRLRHFSLSGQDIINTPVDTPKAYSKSKLFS